MQILSKASCKYFFLSIAESLQENNIYKHMSEAGVGTTIKNIFLFVWERKNWLDILVPSSFADSTYLPTPTKGIRTNTSTMLLQRIISALRSKVLPFCRPWMLGLLLLTIRCYFITF